MDWLINFFKKHREDMLSKTVWPIIGFLAAVLVKELLSKIIPPANLRKYLFKNLLKPSDIKPEVFRPTGRPEYVDFDKQFVYLRPETESILRQLRQNPVIGVKGMPASGKTYLVYSIGYALLKSMRLNPLKKNALYYIALKEQAPTESQRTTIRNLPKRALVIIDDCHLNSKFVEQLFAPEKPRCRVLLFSRPLDPLFDRIFNGEPLIELDKNTPAVGQKILALYEARAGLKTEEKIRKLILEKYANDLVLLVFALKALQHGDKLTEGKIDDRVTAYFAKEWLFPEAFSSFGFYESFDDCDRNKIRPVEAVTIFLLLAAAYRYEILLPRTLLEKHFAIKEEHLDILAKSRTVTVAGLFVGLPHSELANIILRSTDINDSVKALIKELPGDFPAAFPDGVLHKYLQNYPENALDVIYHIYFRISLMQFMLASKELQSMRVVLPFASAHKETFRDKLGRQDDLLTGSLFFVYIYIANPIICNELIIFCGDVLGGRFAGRSLDEFAGRDVIGVLRLCSQAPAGFIRAIEERIKISEVDINLGIFLGEIGRDHRDVGALRKTPLKDVKLSKDPIVGKEVDPKMYDAVWDTIEQISPNFTAYLSSNPNVKAVEQLMTAAINRIKAEENYEKRAFCLAAVSSRNLELGIWLFLESCNSAHKDVANVIVAIAHVNPNAKERFEWIVELEKREIRHEIAYDFEQRQMKTKEVAPDEDSASP